MVVSEEKRYRKIKKTTEEEKKEGRQKEEETEKDGEEKEEGILQVHSHSEAELQRCWKFYWYGIVFKYSSEPAHPLRQVTTNSH